MKAFVGQTRSGEFVQSLWELGIGEMTQPTEYPPRRTPWALDNGAFAAFSNNRPFDATAFGLAVSRWSHSPRYAVPEFIAIPDVVADRSATLALAGEWVENIRLRVWPRLVPLAFVVQDGMVEADVKPFLGDVDVIFIGGTSKWKWNTSRLWCDFAHAHGKRLHIGRVSTPRLVRAARSVGADSLDSCFPLWTRERLAEFVEALRGFQPGYEPQIDLFTESAFAANDNSDPEETAC